MEYIKLNGLVNKLFTITTNRGFKYKAWDATNNKMLVSNTPQKGFSKVFTVETDKGILDLRANQLGTILSECLNGMTANLDNKTIEVKSNGQTGQDIRYFFNIKVSEEIQQEDIPNF